MSGSVEDAAAARTMRADFLHWQCLVRQKAMRKDGGRPSPGMRARILDMGGQQIADGVIMLLTPGDAASAATQFSHIVRQTHDPRERYEKGLRLLSATYYRRADEFDEILTALLPPAATARAQLLALGRCRLDFEQAGQCYSLPCDVEESAADSPIHQCSLWHNRIFNPNLPDTVAILAFRPDWGQTESTRMPVDMAGSVGVR